MTSPLEAATAGIRQATTAVPTGVEGIYQALGELEELIRMLGGYTGRLGTAAAGLPGITGGLRIDDVGEPIPPESVRDYAAAEVRAASDGLAQAEKAISAAHQLAGRLYIAD